MATTPKTVIVTGASQGIGAAIANLFIDLGYNVVANSRNISAKNELRRSDNLALVDGDISHVATAERIIAKALERFGTVDVLVNNAGLFSVKQFTQYTADEFRAMCATNLEGFLYPTQLFVKQVLAQRTGGTVVSITASLADHPLAALTASVPMITKGGINAISKSLAIEYAKPGIRFTVVAPGMVDTPLLNGIPRNFLRTLSPLGRIVSPGAIAEAVLYLVESSHVTGEILHVDSGAHAGQW